MLKALLWKEWREQRAITAAGLGLALLTPALLTAWAVGSAGARDLWVAAELSAFVSAAIVWPLLAAIVGATTGGDELSRGTLRFLMSRPVSRERIWLTKTLTGALSLAAVVGFSFAVSASFSSFAGNEKLLFPFTTGLPGFAAIPNSVLRVYLAGAVVLVYVAAVFFAAFVARPMASAMLGLAAAVGLCGMILTIQRALAYQPWDLGGSEPFAFAALAAASGVVLAAGLLLYRISNAGTSERSRRAGGVIGVAVLAAVAGSTALVGAATTRIDPRRSSLQFLASVPGADEAVVTADGGDWVGSQYFVLDADGSFQPLTPRMSGRGALSPDGRFFAYVTGIGTAGLRGAGCGIRMVGLDGRGDRELARFPGIGGSSGGCRPRDMRLAGMEFSPDESRLALVVDGSLFVIDTDGGTPPRRVTTEGVTHDAAPTSDAEARARRAWDVRGVVGWSSDGSRIVMRGPTFVATIEADSGAVVRRIDVPQGDFLGTLPSRGAQVLLSHRRRMGLTDDGNLVYERQVSVFDADSGEMTDVVSVQSDTWLGAWGTIDEVIYLVGPDDEPEEERERFRVLHRFDSATGTDQEVARFADSAFVYMSPDEGVFLVASWEASIRRENNVWHVTVFGKGAPQSFDLPRGWRIDGWMGAHHLAVSRELHRRPRGERVYEVAIADLDGSLVTVARREY